MEENTRWKSDGLNGSLSGFRAVGPPTRTLEISFIVRNRFDFPVVLWRSRVSAQVGGVNLGEGDFLHVHYAAVERMTLAPGAENPGGEIHIPISPEAIQWIERFRRDDVEVNLHVRCWLAPVISEDQLGVPWENTVSAPPGASFGRFKIPQSKWIEFLRSWGHADIQLLELTGDQRSGRLGAAWQRWDEAVDAFRLGQHENVFTCCFRSIEAAARVVTPAGSTKADLKAITQLLERKDIGPYYDTVLKEFNQLLHVGRHDQEAPSLRPNRRDALFALGVTHAVLMRFG